MRGAGPVLSALQDAWGYLWFVAADGGRFGDPDIPWGYGDPSLCQELRDLGSAGLLRRNVVERVNMYAPWYWASTIASVPLRRLEKMRATQLAFELVTAAKRINHGVFSPNGFLVFGNAQMDSGFSVRAASVDFSDDLREDVQTFWQDHLMELGHRNGPALIAHQIVKRLEDSGGWTRWQWSRCPNSSRRELSTFGSRIRPGLSDCPATVPASLWPSRSTR